MITREQVTENIKKSIPDFDTYDVSSREIAISAYMLGYQQCEIDDLKSKIKDFIKEDE